MSSISSVFSIAGSGLTHASNQMTATAQKIVNDTTETSGGGIDTSDLTKNTVDLISEKTAIQANALVLKTANQMVGTLLDIFDTKKPD